MADFKPIETQEDFDAAIQKRLAQKEREVAARYEGWMSPDDVAKMKGEYEKSISDSAQKLADHDKTVADLTARATKAEHTLLRQQVAASKGPEDLLVRRRKRSKRMQIPLRHILLRSQRRR